MRVLFITRKFPPTIGGMERAAYDLYTALRPLASVCLVKYGGPNKYLPIVYPVLFIRALWVRWRHRPDVIFLQDGMLAPMGVALHRLVRRPCVMSVHGLDVTYKNGTYQKMVRMCFPKLDHIVVGSEQTKLAVRERLPKVKLTKIIYGVNDKFYIDESRDKLKVLLAQEIGLTPPELFSKKLVVTTGRLVERKGVAWFIDSVLPGLVLEKPEVLYLVAGSGPQKDRILELIRKHSLEKNVRLLGHISDDLRDLLYNTADIFLMPNVCIPGDMEGFGLVALEASSCGTPVLASGIEGIKDAVVDNTTGYLLRPNDVEHYTETICRELTHSSFDRKAVRQYVLESYSWQKAATQYLKVFKKITCQIVQREASPTRR